MLSDFKVNGEKDRITDSKTERDVLTCHIRRWKMTLKISSLMQWSTGFLLLVQVPGLSEEGFWSVGGMHLKRSPVVWQKLHRDACRTDDYKLSINTQLSWGARAKMSWQVRVVRPRHSLFERAPARPIRQRQVMQNDIRNKREVQHQIRAAQTIPRAASVCPVHMVLATTLSCWEKEGFGLYKLSI